MDEATRGGGVAVAVRKNAVEDVELAEGSVEEDLAVALAHAPVAGTVADRGSRRAKRWRFGWRKGEGHGRI